MDYEEIIAAADALRALSPLRPRIGVVLGSGLGAFADTLETSARVPFGAVPGLLAAGVAGHAGHVVVGHCGSVPVLVMQGRVHRYEGHPLAKVVLPVRAMVAAGCQTILLTNASGGIAETLHAGSLVLIRDHLNLTGENPLIGANDDRLGPRFPDMTFVYAESLRTTVHAAAQQMRYTLLEAIYAGLSGPSYETPAEIRLLRMLGADVVGMSTVHEAIAAVHMGARVAAISCVTNKAAGLGAALSHAEAEEVARQVRPGFVELVTRAIGLIDAGDAA